MAITFMDAIRGERSLYCWRVPGGQKNGNLGSAEEQIWRKIFRGFKALSEHPQAQLQASCFTIYSGCSKDFAALLIGVDKGAPKSVVSFVSGLLADMAAPAHPDPITTPATELLTPHYRYARGSVKCYRSDAEDVGKQKTDEQYNTGITVTFYDLVDPAFLNGPEEYNNEA